MNLYRPHSKLTPDGVEITGFECVAQNGVAIAFIYPGDWLVPLTLCDEKRNQQWITPEDLAPEALSTCDGVVIKQIGD